MFLIRRLVLYPTLDLFASCAVVAQVASQFADVIEETQVAIQEVDVQTQEVPHPRETLTHERRSDSKETRSPTLLPHCGSPFCRRAASETKHGDGGFTVFCVCIVQKAKVVVKAAALLAVAEEKSKITVAYVSLRLVCPS